MASGVVSCPSCGTKNRVPDAASGSPRCAKCRAPLPWLVETTDAGFAGAVDTSRLVLVDLWAPWCGPCRMVAPILEKLSDDLAGQVKVVKVNVDENPGLSQQFQATSIPTMLVLKDGRVVDRIVGALPPNDLKMRLFPYLMKS
jgi:thioredoxin 2